MFKSLIYFQFIFICGMRKCFNFIILHAAIPISQHHLLKMAFSLLYIFASFVVD